jgi:hypothetical protein
VDNSSRWLTWRVAKTRKRETEEKVVFVLIKVNMDAYAPECFYK